MSDVTRLLDAAAAGDPHAAADLLPPFTPSCGSSPPPGCPRNTPGQTLQATALVHEAYLRLVGVGGASEGFNSRGHFFAAAAEAMRRILIDRARQRHSQKRGGDRQRVELDAGALLAAPDDQAARLAGARPGPRAV
jgi:ECF sigma factor.